MARLLMVVLWPSFLVAIMAEGLFFSFFDPAELPAVGANAVMTPLAVYTAGFFFFWVLCALASMLTSYLIGAPGDRRPPIH